MKTSKTNLIGKKFKANSKGYEYLNSAYCDDIGTIIGTELRDGELVYTVEYADGYTYILWPDELELIEGEL